MRRILFFSEDASLAQVVRLVQLAGSLHPTRFEVHFACARFDPLIFQETSFRRHQIFSLPREEILRRAEKGTRPYNTELLHRYVREDLALIKMVKPHLLVGDLRLSLSVSAPASGIPYACLINAYWSRFWETKNYPLPDHPINRHLGKRVARVGFSLVRPLVFQYFSAPVNRLRLRYGLRPLGDLQDWLMDGDYTLFADVPQLVPLSRQSVGERYLGPVLWSPKTRLPGWWGRWEPNRPRIYLTLGSSGAVGKLPVILAALGKLPITVLYATAGRSPQGELPANVLAADYLPGALAASMSDLVICNGGSTTAYQALQAGKPVVGIPANLDQFLSMAAIAESGAGVCLPASAVDPESVRAAVLQGLEDPTFGCRARQVAAWMSDYPAETRFSEFVEGIMQTGFTNSSKAGRLDL